MNWNFTFSILNALGSLATFGAFLFLFFKDKQKQVQIDKLTDISTNLKEQNDLANQKFKLTIKPKIEIGKAFYNGTDGEADFEIKNCGSYAKLVSYTLKSDDVISHNEHIPYELKTDSSRKFFIRTKGKKHIKDCEYEVDIDFEDKTGHLYRVNLSGIGIKLKINNENEI